MIWALDFSIVWELFKNGGDFYNCIKYKSYILNYVTLRIQVFPARLWLKIIDLI